MTQNNVCCLASLQRKPQPRLKVCVFGEAHCQSTPTVYQANSLKKVWFPVTQMNRLFVTNTPSAVRMSPRNMSSRATTPRTRSVGPARVSSCPHGHRSLPSSQDREHGACPQGHLFPASTKNVECRICGFHPEPVATNALASSCSAVASYTQDLSLQVAGRLGLHFERLATSTMCGDRDPV